MCSIGKEDAILMRKTFIKSCYPFCKSEVHINFASWLVLVELKAVRNELVYYKKVRFISLLSESIAFYSLANFLGESVKSDNNILQSCFLLNKARSY